MGRKTGSVWGGGVIAHPPLSEGEKTEALFVVAFFVTFSEDREYTIFYHCLGSWWGRGPPQQKKILARSFFWLRYISNVFCGIVKKRRTQASANDKIIVNFFVYSFSKLAVSTKSVATRWGNKKLMIVLVVYLLTAVTL